ncbi:DUF4279 domain-containing protein [Persicobacter sp. CCB-QB2]|uniref:DUF4279 domain-containing protein n=1 Tax=Persicobacter sp. CCB-QB2 TaxID=1561025 RepID=UPI0006A963B8|nr:DUF4279 domain-containing protein [Persicobacter sp. CCB-QB2]
MSKNKYNTHVYFSLVGDNFSPDKVSSELAIEPTESWQTGDKGKYKKELAFSCWKLSTEKGKEYLDVDKLVNEIVYQLKDKIDIINGLKQKYRLDSVLQIVLDIDMNPDQPTPYLGHDLETIDFLFKTKTKTDVDIYRFDSRV